MKICIDKITEELIKTLILEVNFSGKVVRYATRRGDPDKDLHPYIYQPMMTMHYQAISGCAGYDVNVINVNPGQPMSDHPKSFCRVPTDIASIYGWIV